MSNTAIFVALLVGVLVWLAVASRLTAKSWKAGEQDGDVGAIGAPPARVGLYVFMAVVTSLFTLFVSAYSMRMHHGEWCHLTIPGILWFNSALLILASVAMQRARNCADRGERGGALSALVTGGLLTVGFLGGQILAWQDVGPSVYFLQGSPAIAFFYVLTIAHGLHLLGGLYVLARAAARFAQGAELIDLRLSLQLCAVYWHFLLLVWVGVFGVLLFL